MTGKERLKKQASKRPEDEVVNADEGGDNTVLDNSCGSDGSSSKLNDSQLACASGDAPSSLPDENRPGTTNPSKLEVRRRSAGILNDFFTGSSGGKNLPQTKLDTNVRKISSFINKIRNLSGSTGNIKVSSLEEEMARFNLTKYLSEISTAVASLNIGRVQLAWSVAHLCLLISVRYESYAKELNIALQSALGNRWCPSQQASATQFRNELRLLTELLLNGVFSVDEDAKRAAKKHLYRALESVLCSAAESAAAFPHSAVMLQYLRQYVDEIVAERGSLPANGQTSDEDSWSAKAVEMALLRVQMRSLNDEDLARIKRMFLEYYAKIVNHTKAIACELRRIKGKNLSILHTKGELFVERQRLEDEYVGKLGEFRRLCVSYSQLLCDEPIDFGDEVDGITSSDRRNGGEMNEDGCSDAEKFWENDEADRDFYRALPTDLQVVSVAERKGTGALVEPHRPVADLKRPANRKKTSAAALLRESVYDSDILDSLGTDDEQESGSAGKRPAGGRAEFDQFFDELRQKSSVELMDECARRFLSDLNTKSNRARLVQSMTRLSRTHHAILPFYARFLATICSVYKDFRDQLTSSLTRQIRFHLRRKDQGSVDLKVRRMRLIGELVKFEVFDKQDALSLLRQMLNNFVYQNVEMACALLETCGPYLCFCSSSSGRCHAYLEIMTRKAKASLLADRYRNLVEQACNSCNAAAAQRGAGGDAVGGSTGDLSRPQRPASCQYFHYLLSTKMSRTSIYRISRSLFKLDWTDPLLYGYARERLSRPELVCFHHIVHLAHLLFELSLHPALVGLPCQVVDLVIEIVCSELGDLLNTSNQKLICLARYLAELYNFELLDYDCLVKVLYVVLCPPFHPQEHFALNDPPHSLIRIRMVCCILAASGARVEHGEPLKQFIRFAHDFQCYAWFKRSLPCWQQSGTHFPPDLVQSIVDGIRKVDRDIVLARNLAQAIERRDKHYLRSNDLSERVSSVSDEGSSGDESSSSATMTDETTRPLVAFKPRSVPHRHHVATDDSDEEADMEMLKLLDQHVAEQYQQRGSGGEGNKRPEIASLSSLLPMVAKPSSGSVWLNRQYRHLIPEDAQDRYYRLLSRRTGKVHLQTIASLPVSEELAKRIEAHREREHREHEELKRRTLDISMQQLIEEQQMQEMGIAGTDQDLIDGLGNERRRTLQRGK